MGPAGGPAETAAESVGGQAAVVGSVTVAVGMADRPEESVGSGIPMGARAAAPDVPVPCWGQAARAGDSIPANCRAGAPAELSLAPLCPVNMNASATDVGFVEYGHWVARRRQTVATVWEASRQVERRDRVGTKPGVVHIGLSKHLTGTKVTVLINDLDIRVLNQDSGQLIRKLVLDPSRDYQPRGVKPGNSPENRPKV